MSGVLQVLLILQTDRLHGTERVCGKRLQSSQIKLGLHASWSPGEEVLGCKDVGLVNMSSMCLQLGRPDSQVVRVGLSLRAG